MIRLALAAVNAAMLAAAVVHPALWSVVGFPVGAITALLYADLCRGWRRRYPQVTP